MILLLEFEVDRFVFARGGSSLALSCEVGEGQEVKWVKDNRNSVASRAGTLWFSEVDQSHAGEYTCSLKKKSFNYFITVQGESMDVCKYCIRSQYKLSEMMCNVKYIENLGSHCYQLPSATDNEAQKN